MGFGWEEIDKTLDLGYIRVAGLHRECKPAVPFDPPNFCPHTMTHTCIHTSSYMYTYNASQIACSFSLGTSMICTKHRFSIIYECMGDFSLHCQIVLNISKEGMLARHTLGYLGRTLCVWFLDI